MRTVTIFLSCPGDLLEAKDELTAVVHEVANHFRPLDIYVAPWRHDPLAIPGVGSDAQEVVTRQLPNYDIYLGLLCGRLGTPTARAAGGTVEEFLDARERYQNTGRPEILFYFCAEPPTAATPDDQREKVVEFRRCFPGLFGTFHSVGELRALVKDHLIDLLLREIGEPAPPSHAWLIRMGEALDGVGGGNEYLDRSSTFAQRLVEKFRGLIDLPTTLQPQEIDALIAAIHLRAFVARSADDSQARRILRETPGLPDWLEDAAAEVSVLAAGPPDDLLGEEMFVGEARCHLLAALLQMGELLDLDHASICGSRPAVQPVPEADLRYWLAYHTRRISVRRPGIVTHEMVVARDSKNIDEGVILSRCAALTFEAAWQQRRRILTANGIAVSRAPVRVDKSSLVAPLPISMHARIESASAQSAALLPELLHLSEDSSDWPAAETLLPLPRSALLTDLCLRWERGRSCALQVWARDRHAVIAMIPASASGEARIPAAKLDPSGSVHVWELVEDLGSFSSTVAWGEVWTLPTNDRRRWNLVAAANRGRHRHAWQRALGLWNDLVDELWPRLSSGMGDPSEAALVNDVLLATYDWLRERAPESARIDAIRNAAQLLHSTYLNPQR